jgi:hypothetical protein
MRSTMRSTRLIDCVCARRRRLTTGLTQPRRLMPRQMVSRCSVRYSPDISMRCLLRAVGWLRLGSAWEASMRRIASNDGGCVWAEGGAATTLSGDLFGLYRPSDARRISDRQPTTKHQSNQDIAQCSEGWPCIRFSGWRLPR